MTSFNTLQSISSRLNELTNQLSISKLSKEELLEFETLSRKLYERAVILNYKAKEESVYGKSSDKKVNPILPFSIDEADEVEETQEIEPIAENYMEAIVEQHEIVEEEEEDDFEEEVSVGNIQVAEVLEEEEEKEIEESKPEKEIIEEDGRVQFDFSGGFDTSSDDEEPEEEPIQKSEPITQKIEEPKKVEEPIKVEPKVEVEQDDIVRHSIAQTEESAIQQNTSPTLDEMLQGSDGSESKTASFYERFSKAYKAAAGDRLGTSKIGSLKGAIGLNDRMLFISELFNGDANYFNETIEKLDQLENNEIAMRKLSEIAAKENWNKEDSSVDEFAHLITRRYVD